MECMKCRYSMIATDDAYGATIRWVEGCKLTESGKPCPYGIGDCDLCGLRDAEIDEEDEDVEKDKH